MPQKSTEKENRMITLHGYRRLWKFEGEMALFMGCES
jgi:hypothetical protein